jgi:transposase
VSSGPERLSRKELLALVVAQAQLIEQLQAQVRELESVVAAQEQRIAELERRLGRNSGNSSMPPSADDLPGRTPPADRPAGGGGGTRMRGKQPGAPGAHLPWRADPDQTVAHFPVGRCGCGADLADGADLGVARSHQQHEIPLVSASCTQHDLHAVRCGCGTVHLADRPAGVADTPVGYGPNLQAWCVYLMVVHAVPVHRCAELVTSLTGAAPSVGFVHGLLTRTAAALVEVDRRIRTLITLAYAVCCDETPIRVGPRRAKKYLLVACTTLYTWYHLGDRSLATFKEFVLGELSGVVVHDRYCTYDSAVFGQLVHQLCTAHLLRDLADAAECYPTAHWPTQIADALRDLIHAANAARAAGLDAIDDQLRETRIDWLRHGVRVGLSEVHRNPDPKGKQPPGRSLLEVLRDRPDDVLRFAHDLNVPPTSNQAERDLRPAKTQQKISGRLTSEAVTRARYRIRGYLSTAAKHGVDQLTAIRDTLLGNAWMPPARAPA